ncbi:hypothetical protein TPHA_0L00350 [Tetrapisispora phaffii CBS 4417]|uniref:Zn(2)-C6 fungal-type domain-containing protein n=1 Tax=Tetrapisispora phaffii (strain ATCC 24235 / CBS 4417 / NBRC 1672 / NRRL Y-8282 / UCD 70-5) TaxID=1071381 RepID=G8BZR3_TETPH|nr:hypothetical protein TPHA_0L00350 [Tetrapisispora phaffii CBS 4417]CCE65391.1 hypothetical protein TPHA_0L00350 [Tetrapisispora phaffii CBS 4417]
MGSKSNRTSSKKWKRSFRACQTCRERKIKCNLGPLDNPHKPPCERCKREQRECIFVEPSRKSRSLSPKDINYGDDGDDNKLKFIHYQQGDNKGANNKEIQNMALEDSAWESDVSSMQNALEYLASAAKSVSQFENHKPTSKLSDMVNSYSKDDMTQENIIKELFEKTELKNPASSLIAQLSRIRTKPHKKLSDIVYIGDDKLLTEEEARRLIEVFFQKLHPFFPYIPLQLHNPEQLVRYPILLCAVITISARYNNFGDLDLKTRESPDYNITIHEKLWMYCQRLISRTIWAEASTRSIGTILAFLLFTEWNPRAIHWNWSDYANDSETINFNELNEFDPINSYKGESITGFEAMRHSDRMAWMLTGSAVRLAQDMKFIDTSNKIFLATHIAETYNAMNVNLRSSLSESLSNVNIHSKKIDPVKIIDGKKSERYFGNEKYYLEQIFKNAKDRESSYDLLENILRERRNAKAFPDNERDFLNDEYILFYSNPDDATQNDELDTPLDFTVIQRAKIELLKIMSIGYETIYLEKGRRYTTANNQKQNLAMLNIFSALIDSWYVNYNELLSPEETLDPVLNASKMGLQSMTQIIENESLICDYYYCQLYIYSLSLQVEDEESKLKLKELSQSAKYVSIAYSSAKEILNSAKRLQEVRMLKFIPVRWVIRIVRAISFIVKCYVTATDKDSMNYKELNSLLSLSGIPVDESLELIHTAAVLLKESTPDELHLCTRYSKILLCLYRELKMDTLSTQQAHGNDSMPERLTADTTLENAIRTEFTTTSNSGSQVELTPLSNKLATLPIDRNTTPPYASFPTEVVDWFSTSADIGLEFVEPWTEMIEQRYIKSGNTQNKDFDDLLSTIPK